jgi:hypothetical protein
VSDSDDGVVNVRRDELRECGSGSRAYLRLRLAVQASCCSDGGGVECSDAGLDDVRGVGSSDGAVEEVGSIERRFDLLGSKIDDLAAVVDKLVSALPRDGRIVAESDGDDVDEVR